MQMHWYIVQRPCVLLTRTARRYCIIRTFAQLHDRNSMYRRIPRNKHRHTNAHRVSFLRLPCVVVRTSKSELFSNMLLNSVLNKSTASAHYSPYSFRLSAGSPFSIYIKSISKNSTSNCRLHMLCSCICA